MNVERTIEFIIENQARMDARFEDKFGKAEKRFVAAEQRLDRLERVAAQNNRIVAQLARYGVSLRDDVRRLDKAMALLAERHAETDDKLNGLIDVVRRHLQGNGHRK